MCNIHELNNGSAAGIRTLRLTEAVGMVIAHDITEIKPGKFKGRAFKKGHIIKKKISTTCRSSAKKISSSLRLKKTKCTKTMQPVQLQGHLPEAA